MPCLLALIAFFFPRFVIILLVITGDYIGRAFQNDLWAFLGFLFMPYTTLAYAWGINTNGSIDGLYLIAVVIGVLMDLGAMGGGESARRRKFKRV